MTTAPGIRRPYYELKIGTGTWTVLKDRALGNVRILLRDWLAMGAVCGVNFDPPWQIYCLAFPGGGLVRIKTGSKTLPVYQIQVKDAATAKEFAEQLVAN